MKKIKLTLLCAAIATVYAEAQTKKVIIEDYTGTWCGWCPEGTVLLEGLEKNNPATLIPIATHSGDALEVPEGKAMVNGLNVTGFPSGSVDRKLFSGEAEIPLNRGYWTTYFNQQAAATAIVSVSFDKAKYNPVSKNYTADVNVKFTAKPTSGVPLKIQVYILEDSIAATGTYAQSNYSNKVQSGASPLANWYHNHTLRDALGGDWGFSGAIPATPALNTSYKQSITFTVDSTKWVKKNIHLVAFVAYDGTVASGQKEILNAEEISLSSFFPTGLNDVNDQIGLISAYPNPAASNDIVKIEYNIKETSKVKLNVYNAMGQLIASPYNSLEVEGAHTMRWRASDYDLAPGMYVLELSTDKGGRQIFKVNVL